MAPSTFWLFVLCSHGAYFPRQFVDLRFTQRLRRIQTRSELSRSGTGIRGKAEARVKPAYTSGYVAGMRSKLARDKSDFGLDWRSEWSYSGNRKEWCANSLFGLVPFWKDPRLRQERDRDAALQSAIISPPVDRTPVSFVHEHIFMRCRLTSRRRAVVWSDRWCPQVTST